MRPERELFAPAGPRLLALHLPDLPLQRLARGRELASDRPVAVVEEGRVHCCDAAARAAGVRPGQAQAEALAACGRLLAVAHAPAADLGRAAGAGRGAAGGGAGGGGGRTRRAAARRQRRPPAARP